MSNDQDGYLIWSHEHRAWWGPGRRGYTVNVAEAGVYSREVAVRIAARAIPGTAHRMGALPELPVAVADLDAMRAEYARVHPHVPLPDFFGP